MEWVVIWHRIGNYLYHYVFHNLESDVSGQHSSSSGSPISYRDAGVDIDAGNSLIERIKPVVAKTRRAGVVRVSAALAPCLNSRSIATANHCWCREPMA